MSTPIELTETRRIYTFPNGARIAIENPTHLVPAQEGHTLLDSNGNGHFIPTGWIHLFWEPKRETPENVSPLHEQVELTTLDKRVIAGNL